MKLAYNVVVLRLGEQPHWCPNECEKILYDEDIVCELDDLKAVLAKVEQCARMLRYSDMFDEWLRRKEAKG